MLATGSVAPELHTGSPAMAGSLPLRTLKLPSLLIVAWNWPPSAVIWVPQCQPSLVDRSPPR